MEILLNRETVNLTTHFLGAKITPLLCTETTRNWVVTGAIFSRIVTKLLLDWYKTQLGSFGLTAELQDSCHEYFGVSPR